MRSLSFTDRALEFLKALQAKPFKQVVMGVMELTQNPQPHDSKHVKGMRWFPASRMKRSGKRRISVLYRMPK